MVSAELTRSKGSIASPKIQFHNQAIAGHQSLVNKGHPYLTDGADVSPKRSVAIVSAILFGAGIP